MKKIIPISHLDNAHKKSFSESNINKKLNCSRSSCSYVNSIKLIFDKLDIDNDGFLSVDDLQKFEVCSTIQLSSLIEKINETDKKLDLPELLNIYKNGMELCKNFINFHQSKLYSLKNKQNSLISKLNFEDMTLINETIIKVGNKKVKQLKNYRIKSSTDKIEIDDFLLNLEDHFAELLLNTNYEIKKNLNLKIEAYGKSGESIVNIEQKLIKINKAIKDEFNHINFYKEISNGISLNLYTVNDEFNLNQFIKYFIQIISLRKSEAQENINFSYSNDSFMSTNTSARESSNFHNRFRKESNLSNYQNAKVLDSRDKLQNTSKIIPEFFVNKKMEESLIVDEKVMFITKNNNKFDENKILNSQPSLFKLLNLAINSSMSIIQPYEFNVCMQYLKLCEN